MGGIRTASDAIEFILAGASAVAAGTANFIEPGCTGKIIEGISKFCQAHQINSVRELTGAIQ
jgi:dihydroorotate dehydrogenase (NAD+) catalytic subunit